MAVATIEVSPFYQLQEKPVSESVLPESQCGFTAGRSTSDMKFTLHQLQEKVTEQQKPLYILFVDFSKAFDTTDRTTLWKVLKIYGCPYKFTDIARVFHDYMSAVISVGGRPVLLFQSAMESRRGVYWRRLCLHSTSLQCWNMCLAGVYIRRRSDVGLFNLARLHATSSTLMICVRKLLYADDSALVAASQQETGDY